MIRCTARTRSEKNRCVREIGHAGLHRVVVEKKVNEFSDSNAEHPLTGFTTAELNAIIKGDFE